MEFPKFVELRSVHKGVAGRDTRVSIFFDKIILRNSTNTLTTIAKRRVDGLLQRLLDPNNVTTSGTTKQNS